VLSTTLKAKLRAKRTEKEKHEKEGGDMMDMDHPPAEEEHAEKMQTDEKEEPAEEGKKKKKKKEEEPQFEILSNLSRVVPAQLKYISFPEGSRYVPVKKPTGGVLIMRDLKPDEEVELIEMKVPLGNVALQVFANWRCPRRSTARIRRGSTTPTPIPIYPMGRLEGSSTNTWTLYLRLRLLAADGGELGNGNGSRGGNRHSFRQT